MTTTPGRIICPKCKAEHPLAAFVNRRTMAEGVEAVGLLCPTCDAWTHSFFETPEIVEKRAILKATEERFKQATKPRRDQRWQEFQTGKAVFKRLFEDTQKRLARKYKAGELK